MDRGPLVWTALFLAVFISLPLVPGFPVYVIRFVKWRRATRVRVSMVQPRKKIMVLYVWFVVTIPALIIFSGFKSYSRALRMRSGIEYGLSSIETGQTSYFKQHGRFAGEDVGEKFLTDLMPNDKSTYKTIYTYYVEGGHRSPEEWYRPGFDYLPEKDWPLTIFPETSANSFTALAIGNIDSDACPDVWMINDHREVKNLVDDLHDLDLANVCVRCPGAKRVTTLRKLWVHGALPALAIISVPLAASSPLMVIVVPALYFLLVSERRRWLKEMYADAEARVNSPSPYGNNL